MKKNKILIFLLLFISLMFIFIMNNKQHNYTKYNTVVYYSKYLTRMEINDKIKLNKDYYIKEYGEYFKRPDIAKEIIKACLEFDMPINLCFSLGLAESNLNNSRKPNYNKNGSFDYGAFRLNSKTYPDIKNLSKLENNVRQGILHFKDEYLKHNSYDVAIMTYNSGSIDNIGQISVNHLKRVVAYEKALDEWFNSKYWSSVNRNTN